MNITRRRGAIGLFITLGVCLVGLLVTLNIGWIQLLHKRQLAMLVGGIVVFGVLIAGGGAEYDLSGTRGAAQ